MKKYPTYKYSDVEWIGKIPIEWNVGKLKYLSQIKRGASPRPIDDPRFFDDENGEYYWIRISDLTKSGRYLYHTEQKLSELGSSLSYKLESEELVMSISGSVGKVIITKTKCCIHDGFVVFQNLKPNRDYLFYIITNPDLYSEDGKLGTQFNINSDIVGNKYIPILSDLEQAQIVSFLDHKTSIIDDLIQKKFRKIELLKEQRESIISRAVTKGLNTKIEMKDSGERSIGWIPSHWDLTRLKYLVAFDSGYAFKSEDYSPEGVNLIRIGNLYENILDLERAPIYLPISFIKDYPNFVVKENDILISLTGTLGKKDYGYSIVYDKEFPAMLNQRVGRLKVVSEDILFQYLTYQLLCDVFLNQLFIKPTGTKQGNLSGDDILTNYLPLPTISEQMEIVDYLDKTTSEIDKQVDLENRKIELLKEYR